MSLRRLGTGDVTELIAGRYRIEEALGERWVKVVWGVVYRVSDVTTEAVHALKRAKLPDDPRRAAVASLWGEPGRLRALACTAMRR